MRLFVYGTLLDREVRRRVLGHAAGAGKGAGAGARLCGYRRIAVARGDYPVLTPDRAGAAGGRLLAGLSPRDLRRLDAYEGAAYRRVAGWVTARGGGCRAWVYLPAGAVPAGRGWSLAAWRRHRRCRYLAALPAGSAGRGRL